MRHLILALFLIPSLLCAVMGNPGLRDPAGYVHSKNKAKAVDREVLKNEISQTYDHLEALQLQLEAASLSETAEVWASADKDFKLKPSTLKNCQKALDQIKKSLAPGLDKKQHDILEQDARRTLKDIHKGANEEFLSDLRGWIILSEGSLRRARAKEKAAANAAVPPAKTPKASKK